MAATVKPLKYIPNGKNAVRSAKNHIKYITAPRERHRNNPHLFDAKRNYVDRREFITRLKKQIPARRHAFMHKLVISFSEEERDRLQIDLMELTRDAMARFEIRLQRNLDWVAAIHDDEGHPHVHVVYRGRDLIGKPVFIGKEDLKELRKIVEEEKVRQAERTLGVEKAHKILKELKEKERQKRKVEKGRDDKSLSEEMGEGIAAGLTGALAKMIREAEWEHEKERKEATRRMIRERKRKERER